MTNVLFICSANKLRSPTAEHVFADWPQIETDSAGLDARADMRLSSEQLEWADIIFVMENAHRRQLSKNYKKHLKRQRIIVLGIPDNYKYMDAELVRLLKVKVEPHLS